MMTLTKADIELIGETVKDATINNLLIYISNDNKENIETKDINQEPIENSTLENLIETLKTHKNIGKEWWKEYSKRIKSGDIIYVPKLKKFGIFICPSSKENKIKVRLLKNNNKNHAYTTDWIFNIDEVEIVKHNNKINKKFIEDELQFKMK